MPMLPELYPAVNLVSVEWQQINVLTDPSYELLVYPILALHKQIHRLQRGSCILYHPSSCSRCGKSASTWLGVYMQPKIVNVNDKAKHYTRRQTWVSQISVAVCVTTTRLTGRFSGVSSALAGSASHSSRDTSRSTLPSSMSLPIMKCVKTINTMLQWWIPEGLTYRGIYSHIFAWIVSITCSIVWFVRQRSSVEYEDQDEHQSNNS